MSQMSRRSPGGAPCNTPRQINRASSAPLITSNSIPACCRTCLTNSCRLDASPTALVATARTLAEQLRVHQFLEGVVAALEVGLHPQLAGAAVGQWKAAFAERLQRARLHLGVAAGQVQNVSALFEHALHIARRAVDGHVLAAIF